MILPRGARDNWRRHDTSIFSHSVGVPRMETKHVSFSGGSAVLTQVSTAAPTSGYVSMKGMIFSTNSVDTVPSTQVDYSTKMPQGESQPRKPRRQMEAVSSAVLSVTSDSSTISSSASIEKSSDGALMFSTGS